MSSNFQLIGIDAAPFQSLFDLSNGQLTERSIKRWENKEWLLAESPSPAARARMTMQKLYPFSVGEPEHIAALAVFLGSDESHMLTGTTIAADGGRSSYIQVQPLE